MADIDTLDRSPLGKRSPYQDRYDPALLFPVARTSGRVALGIDAEPPFFGMDIWNAYEISWLTRKGKPCVALASFIIPSSTPNIIESKSFKLYLNSFNQTQLENADQLIELLRQDLGRTCGGPVEVSLHAAGHAQTCAYGEMDGECIDELDIEISDYQPAPELLFAEHDTVVRETLISHLLKSNCPITDQPDWASLQVSYHGPRIQRAGLLRYIVSFRQHGGFHEHCVERIYMDLLNRCQPQELSVYARYTRRGGLDINPYRSNAPSPAPANLRTSRQ